MPTTPVSSNIQKVAKGLVQPFFQYDGHAGTATAIPTQPANEPEALSEAMTFLTCDRI